MIYLHGVIGVDVDLELFPFWIKHYLDMGIDAENFLLVFHAKSKNSPNLEKALRILEEHKVNAKIDYWHDEFASHIKYIYSIACRQKYTTPNDWVVVADTDEFQEYPAPLKTFLEDLDAKGFYAVKGGFVDRVAQDYKIKRIVPGIPLDRQFPRKMSITRSVGWANHFKIMAHKMTTLTSPGGGNHSIWFKNSDDFLDKKIFYSKKNLVHHYKWHGDWASRLEDRRKNFKDMGLYHFTESERLLEYYGRWKSFWPGPQYYASIIHRKITTLGYYLQLRWRKVLSKKKPSSEKNAEAVPWINPAAVSFLREKLRADFRIFEYGPGQSTVFFANRCKEVYSVEFHPWFYQQTEKNIPANAHLEFYILDYDGEYSRAIQRAPGFFDVVFVDGRDRVNCVKNSLPKLSPAGVVILDDAQRKFYKEAVDFMGSEGFKQHWLSDYKEETDMSSTVIFYRPGNCFGL